MAPLNWTNGNGQKTTTARYDAHCSSFETTIRDPGRLERVRTVAALGANRVLDRLTRSASIAIRSPVAAVTLVDVDRQLLRSVSGLPDKWRGRCEDLPLSHSFCVHAVGTGRPLIIEDARTHPLVRHNPVVREIGIAAYAGVPLRTKDGLVLGTFNAIEWSPRQWSRGDIDLLHGFAALAVGEIETQLGHTVRARSETAAPIGTNTTPQYTAPTADRVLETTAASRSDGVSETLADRTHLGRAAAPVAGPSNVVTHDRLQRAVGRAFLVGEKIGQGGFSDVYEAFDRNLKRAVALKVPRLDRAAVADVALRLRREAISIASLRHPNVLPIYMLGEGHGLLWLVLARADGGSLASWLRANDPVAITEVTRVMRAVASALGAAHRAGIVHRDLTPGNIMFDGPDRQVLLMDFGLARNVAEQDDNPTQPGLLAGTPHFMSPEQATGTRIDHRSDLYSLGVIAYRMLTGRLPVEGPNCTAIILRHVVHVPEPIRKLRRDCPAWLARIVERCLAKESTERVQSADEVVAAMDAQR